MIPSHINWNILVVLLFSNISDLFNWSFRSLMISFILVQITTKTWIRLMKELGLMCGERKERGDCNDVTGHVTVQCYMRDMRDGEEWDVRRHDSHIHTRKVLKTRLVVDRDKPRNFDFGLWSRDFFYWLRTLQGYQLDHSQSVRPLWQCSCWTCCDYPMFPLLLSTLSR